MVSELFCNSFGILKDFFRNSSKNSLRTLLPSALHNLPLDFRTVNWYGGFHLGIEFLSVSVYLMSQALKNKIAFNSFLLSQNCSILKRRQKQASCAADTVVSSLPLWIDALCIEHWAEAFLNLLKINFQLNLFLVL